MATAHEIYEALCEGKEVKLWVSGPNCPIIKGLLNHLNVIKTRTNKFQRALFSINEDRIISTVPALTEIKEAQEIILCLKDPKPLKNYELISIT